MDVQPENNGFKYVNSFRLSFIIYSAFDSLAGVEALADADESSSFLVGPVCVIGTTRSAFCCSGCLRVAVMVSTPSDDNDD